MENSNNRKKVSGWSFLSVVSFLCSIFTLCKGIDKMTNYYNSDYSSFSKNAYVGGDAYNYIINGNYATAFFVLTTMFVLAAIGLMILHYVSREKPTIAPQVVQKTIIEDIESNLPQI